MANIELLADKAVQIFRSGGATAWKSAARQAVIRSGVSDKRDVEHIASEICRHLQKRSTAVRMKNRRIGAKSTQHREPKQLILPLK